MIPAEEVSRPRNALPFWLSLGTLPLAAIGATAGGWTVVLLPLYTWGLFSLLDAITGRFDENADPQTPAAGLDWYRLITLVWAPLQFLTLFGTIFYTTRFGHLAAPELLILFFGIGVITGTIGITYSHELMHQKPAAERWLGDILLAMVLYSHFRSEHLRVHHPWVGTPRDAVTARYNEGFHRFFPRVLVECHASAFRAERAMLARAKRRWTHRSNPFWRYWALQALMLALAFAAGGPEGLGLFLFQALVAVWQLELVNYIEHYGLTRRHLGQGRYEHVLPRHSWNATHRASNWLLINLQRHSDHHVKPDRRYPLLQTYSGNEAPQLPFGYPLMTMAAMVPPLWKRIMNRRVKAWRKRHYPDIADWRPYNKAQNPMPRGAP
ncbi:alkane 1-monooxygenase [Solirhodobacter olei]|uniref:alkane 1-monooxygenase n=1 Tax=Solirhodobacter olei TaxID=2493082 RepID=UPI000FD8BA10|nr:alkane 1-monooxygenase [Solirhodobacter olei]